MTTLTQPSSRINLNGSASPSAPQPRKRSRTPARASRKTTRPARRPDHLRRWALAYVALAAVMSCGLNAMANGSHAPEGYPQVAAWLMGTAIPCLVLLLGRVAGLLYHRGHRYGAAGVAGVGAFLLFLSVWHCQESIQVLTGAPVWQAVALAVGIDVGLIASEAAALLDD